MFYIFFHKKLYLFFANQGHYRACGSLADKELKDIDLYNTVHFLQNL